MPKHTDSEKWKDGDAPKDGDTPSTDDKLQFRLGVSNTPLPDGLPKPDERDVLHLTRAQAKTALYKIAGLHILWGRLSDADAEYVEGLGYKRPVA